MDGIDFEPVESGPQQNTRGFSRAPGSANVTKPACKRHSSFVNANYHGDPRNMVLTLRGTL